MIFEKFPNLTYKMWISCVSRAGKIISWIATLKGALGLISTCWTRWRRQNHEKTNIYLFYTISKKCGLGRFFWPAQHPASPFENPAVTVALMSTIKMAITNVNCNLIIACRLRPVSQCRRSRDAGPSSPCVQWRRSRRRCRHRTGWWWRTWRCSSTAASMRVSWRSCRSAGRSSSTRRPPSTSARPVLYYLASLPWVNLNLNFH